MASQVIELNNSRRTQQRQVSMIEDIRALDIISKECIKAAEEAASRGEHGLEMEYDGLYLIARSDLEALVEELYRGFDDSDPVAR